MSSDKDNQKSTSSTTSHSSTLSTSSRTPTSPTSSRASTSSHSSTPSQTVRWEALKARVKRFPKGPGVYLMSNTSGKVIYVGKAKELRTRVRSYFTGHKDHSVKTQYLVNQINSIDYMLTNTEVEAFLLEASLIKKHRPRYNIRLKDDKSYPYIRCSLEVNFPRFYLSRKVRNDGAIYFGPYTSGLAVRETIRFVNRVYKIRDCTDHFMKSRKRACMTYQIGRCTAPCVDYITQREYRNDIRVAIEFLKGRNKKVLGHLTKKMKEAAKEERFEAAAKWRDSISATKVIWKKQVVVSPHLDLDQDVIAHHGDHRGTLIETLHIRGGRVIGNRQYFFPKLDTSAESEDHREWLTSFINQYYNENIIPDEIIIPLDLGRDLYQLLGEVFKERQGKESRFIYVHNEEHKKLMRLAESNASSHFQDQVSKQENREKALKIIQKKLRLPELPQRMECFDISNFRGDENVASQVVFVEGLPKKSDYRRYRMRTVDGPNDYASIKEVLERRFHHTEYEDPQLVLVDGGRGQLNIAVQILEEMGRPEIPVVGMAKARTEKGFDKKEIVGSEERFFLPQRQNPVTFTRSAEALQILVQLRDEAHRFAITYHRTLRGKNLLSSELDKVKGLGEKRKKSLLKHFASVQKVRQASVNEICELEGFSKKLVEQILKQLNQK